MDKVAYYDYELTEWHKSVTGKHNELHLVPDEGESIVHFIRRIEDTYEVKFEKATKEGLVFCGQNFMLCVWNHSIKNNIFKGM